MEIKSPNCYYTITIGGYAIETGKFTIWRKKEENLPFFSLVVMIYCFNTNLFVILFW